MPRKGVLAVLGSVALAAGVLVPGSSSAAEAPAAADRPAAYERAASTDEAAAKHPSATRITGAQRPTAAPREADPWQDNCHPNDDGFEVCTIDAGSKDKALYQRMRDLVQNTNAPEIWMAMYTWAPKAQADDFTGLARDLAAKKEGGTDVRVVLGDGCKDSGSGGSCSGSGSGSAKANAVAGERAGTPANKPQEILENAGIPVRVCPKSCLPRNVDGGERKKIQHNKFLLLGNGDGGRVVQTTTNLMTNQLKKFQDLVVVPDDGLYRFYRNYWKRLNQRDWLGWTDSERTQTGASNGTVGHAFPRMSTNPVLRALNKVDACGEGGSVKVAHGQMTHEDVISKLRNGLPSGCDVQVISAGNENLFENINARFSDTHSKFILIDAKYNGSSKRRQLVFTGSHNPKSSALKHTSDAVLRVENSHVFDTYREYFNHQWDLSSR